ncbi:SpoIIE family protein phosphatase [Pengzhenrongella sicca]|uniref:SpoIIE family protein phosphatase n=1 Tax=Pengzhenrongella sicca TaxID=2819238 RepID=A0A8A4ZH70_9MICO|nr:SpoIIE family protein phosphatase [Pengzhenrongella sicca]
MGSGDDWPQALGEVRDRALRATDVSFVITDAADPDTPIVWVNDAFTRTTGYTSAEVIGRNPALLRGPATDRAVTAELNEALAQERAGSATVLNYRKDGEPFWNQVSVAPVRDAAGTVTHWVGVQVDVTSQIERQAAQIAAVQLERRARTGLAIVARVSELLTDLDDPLALRNVAALLASDVVAWAGFFLDDGGLRAADGVDLSAVPRGRPRRHGPPPAARRAADRAGDGGAAADDAAADDAAADAAPDPVQQLLDGVLDGVLELDVDAEHPDCSASGWLSARLRPVLAQLPGAPTVAVVVPVGGRRRVLGVLVAVPLAGSAGPAGLDGLDENAHTVLYLTARRVGMAVDNVRLYAREHQLAETLQRAMLPEQAEIDGLDVWTYYAPNSEHAQIGGDWYDVLQISPDVVGVVIGDVVGHDVEAAAAMGQLRSVVRAYTFEIETPGPVLDRVDQLVAGMRIPRSASLVLATLTRAAGGWGLEYSRAGHLPALLVRAGEVSQLAGASGSLIGFGSSPRATARADLRPGDVLVLYTDGLIERRDRPLREGLDALVAACGEVTAIDSAGVGEDLLSRLADAPEDDVALVVVRLPDPLSDGDSPRHSPRRRRWLLPGEPVSIGRARHAVLRTCRAWQLDEVASAELVVSELVANAVLHGWGQISLGLFDTGDGLRIEVEDSNPAPPVTTDGHAGRIGGYGMQIVERLADWGWRPTRRGKLVWARLRS